MGCTSAVPTSVSPTDGILISLFIIVKFFFIMIPDFFFCRVLFALVCHVHFRLKHNMVLYSFLCVDKVLDHEFTNCYGLSWIGYLFDCIICALATRSYSSVCFFKEKTQMEIIIGVEFGTQRSQVQVLSRRLI